MAIHGPLSQTESLDGDIRRIFASHDAKVIREGYGQLPAWFSRLPAQPRRRQVRSVFVSAGAARDELQVDHVVLRIQANPQEPRATADFDLVRFELANEVSRERWSLSLQFLFLEEIPSDLIVFNPMRIVITYLQGDRAIVTGDL